MSSRNIGVVNKVLRNVAEFGIQLLVVCGVRKLLGNLCCREPDRDSGWG